MQKYLYKKYKLNIIHIQLINKKNIINILYYFLILLSQNLYLQTTKLYIKTMRHLLNYKYTTNRFTTLKTMIKRKTKQIKQFEKNKSIEFQSHLKNLIVGSQVRQRKSKGLGKIYQRLSLTAARPLQTILTDFLERSKKYTEEQLVQTVVHVGKAFQFSLMDHGGHLDRFGHKLIQSPMFDHFIEEVKYGLSDSAYMEPKNVARVLDALGDMNYLDYDVIRMAIQKIQKILNLKQRDKIKFEQRLYQSQKRDYYKPHVINLDKGLLQNKIFKNNLIFFEEKKKQYVKKQIQANLDKEQPSVVAKYQDIIQLLNQFEKFNKGADKLLEGIIAVRRQYKKLVTISQLQKVMRNPQLDSAILQIQQKLLQMHLITIDDITNPQEVSKQNQKVQSILRYFMSEAKVDNFEDYFVIQPLNLEYLKQKRQKQLNDFASLLQSLAKYANLPFRLRGTDDNVSLLNVKWQRFILQDKFQQNNLNVESMFRRVFIETQMFFSRNLTALELIFIEADLRTKLKWYSSILQLGFVEKTYYQFKSLNLVPDNLKNLNSKQIFYLTKALNNSYQKQFSHSQNIYAYIEQRLSIILEQQVYPASIGELTQAINYLYQASYHQKCPLNQKLYANLIQRLSQQVKYCDQSPSFNKRLATQAKKILYFQDPQGSQYTGAIQKLNQLQNLKNEKANPYLKVLFESLKSSQTNDLYTTPYITTGVNDNNEITGIYITNSDNSGFQGQFVSGNINAYCTRLQNKFGIKVTPLPLKKFVNIIFPKTYTEKISKDVIIGLKNSQQILAEISPYLSRNNQTLTDFIKSVCKQIGSIFECSGNTFKAKKILSSLKKLAQSAQNQKQILIIDQFYSKRCQLLVQFNLLKRDLQLLTIQQIKQLENKLNLSQRDQTITFQALIAKVQQQIQRPLSRIQQRFQQICQKDKNNNQINFKGKRITMNLLNKNQNKLKGQTLQNIEFQLLSIPYLLDRRYVEYQDWRNLIKKTANFNQIKLENASELTKLFVMKFCPNIKDVMVAFPQYNGQFSIPFYPLNWQQKYYYHYDNMNQKNQLQKITQQYRKAHVNVKQNKQKLDKKLINLQNYKHQLKAVKSPKQILQLLTSFQFIDDLMLNKLSNQLISKQQATPQLIQRNPQQYFNYLQTKSDKLYLQSPYIQYLFNKIQQIQILKQKVKQRKQVKIKYQMLYSQGIIDRKQYYNNIKQYDLKLISEIKKLKHKVLTHIDGVQILQDGSKIVEINTNLAELQRIVHAANWYDRNQDSDLALAQGNYTQALNIKRARAQTNLIIFKILTLKSTNKQLSPSQTNFFQNWKNSIRDNILNYKTNKNYTKLSVKNLKSKDKQLITLPNTNIIKNNPRLALSDFILEISHFFDQTVINRLQAQIYAEYFGQKYKIPSAIFSTSCNKIFKSLSCKAQDAIFQQNSQLNQRQLNCLIEMTKIFKTQALSDRQKYNIHYKNLRNNLNLINHCRYRAPLTTQYLKQKDYQYYHNYHPQSAGQLKKTEIHKLWLKIFNKIQQQTTKFDIIKKVSQICNIMIFIKLNTPPYFGNFILKILQHPKTDKYTAQKIIAYVELFKIQLKIDSQDLLQLAEPQNIQLQKIMNQMKKYNDINIVKKVYNCL